MVGMEPRLPPPPPPLPLGGPAIGSSLGPEEMGREGPGEEAEVAWR